MDDFNNLSQQTRKYRLYEGETELNAKNIDFVLVFDSNFFFVGANLRANVAIFIVEIRKKRRQNCNRVLINILIWWKNRQQNLNLIYDSMKL